MLFKTTITYEKFATVDVIIDATDSREALRVLLSKFNRSDIFSAVIKVDNQMVVRYTSSRANNKKGAIAEFFSADTGNLVETIHP